MLRQPLTSGTLFLASSAQLLLDNTFSELGELKEKKIAYVTTAAEGVADRAYIAERQRGMDELGWAYEEYTITEESESSIRSFLRDKDVVLVMGGNTFYLMKQIRQSGFEDVMRDLIPQGLIYVGASAGSYVACPSIEMATWKHQDIFDHYNVSDLAGMGLVDFGISAHYKSTFKGPVRAGLAAASYGVKVLTDEQAMLVHDGQVSLVGQGPEIRLVV